MPGTGQEVKIHWGGTFCEKSLPSPLFKDYRYIGGSRWSPLRGPFHKYGHGFRPLRLLRFARNDNSRECHCERSVATKQSQRDGNVRLNLRKGLLSAYQRGRAHKGSIFIEEFR